MNNNTQEIQSCLRAAHEGGSFMPIQSPNDSTVRVNQNTCLVDDDTQGHLPQYASLMKGARKCKRPLGVSTENLKSKQAHGGSIEHKPTLSLQQMEEDISITSVYHMPELSDIDKKAILQDIIKEFKLNENEEQEMSLRIISEHFIRCDMHCGGNVSKVWRTQEVDFECANW